MGLFDFVGDLLLGTEGEAQAKNEANVERALGFLGGVPISELLGLARAQFTDQPRQDIERGFGQAIAGVGAAGTTAGLRAQQAGQQEKSAARKGLAQRGLFGSSLASNATSGIQQQTNLTLADIMGRTAGAQGGLQAGRGQALAGQQFAKENALAQLYGLEANMLLGRAGSQANVLGNVQYQGQPGILGQLLGSAVGGLGGGIGTGVAGLLFPQQQQQQQ